ncbi:MAG: 2-oxo acid dehydrogenase subunit E2 [Ignavibacteriaceae bacterium]|nr:2-oxo acid dehydrogenase subunit E2 [Ignavibacteriaceae bacterium]
MIVKENHLRRMVKDAISLTNGKSHYFIFTETDITGLFSSIAGQKEMNPESPGLTGYLVKSLADTLMEFPELNCMRKGEDTIYRFPNIDVFMPVEKETEGEYIIYPSIIRSAEKMTLEEINKAIQYFRSSDFKPLIGIEKLFLKLPAFLRRAYLRHSLRSHDRYRTIFGTTSFSSVGKVSNERMWPVGNPLRCLELYAGNTVENTDLAGNKTVKINLVFAIDHTIADGAYGLRFISNFTSRLQNAANN